jgi:NAD(P)-dependent dehydrogenase (short-subunit alcohol dehydrogenase family)
MAGRLQGKVAIITGSSRGLGQYCAVAYGREGARVIIAARSESDSERLQGTIYDTATLVEEAGGEAFPVVCNVADFASVESMTRQVLERYGRIDVVMTNAGVQPTGRISSMETRHFELELRVNVLGTFYTVRAALPAMIAQRSGSIITISSGAAASGSHYGATKRAVEGLTLGLAGELREAGIAVNALKPVGSIRTPGAMFRRTPEQQAAYQGMSQESYVEAAVLLALQTPEICTGEVLSDAEAIFKLAGKSKFEEYAKLNPPAWAESVQPSA